MKAPRKDLINARKSKCLSQKDVAKSVGISRGFYANIEIGKYNPSLDVAKSIAATVGKKMDDIF